MQRFTPGLSMAMPEGWVAGESIVLAAPDQGAYIRVTSELLPAALTPEAYADGYAEQLRGRLPGFEEFAVETVRLAGGQTAIMRTFRWTPPDRDARTELHLCTVDGRRGVLARAVGSAEGFAAAESTLRELLLGIGIGTPAARGGVRRLESTPRERTYAAFEAGQLTTTRARAFGAGASNGEHEPEEASR